MLPQRLDLGGDDWQLKGYIGEDWRWRDAHLPQTRDPSSRTPAWIPATVPGSVHHDLWQAGHIPDPYRAQNTLLCEWVSARTWLYRKRFTVDEALPATHLSLTKEVRGNEWRLTIANDGEQAALGVWLEAKRELRAPGYVYYSDNHFHLLPGEQRRITARWDGIAPQTRALSVQSWNAEEQVVYG